MLLYTQNSSYDCTNKNIAYKYRFLSLFLYKTCIYIHPQMLKQIGKISSS